jgi:hypothetical protein
MLSTQVREKLILFGNALIDQKRAHVVVEPMQGKSGFWFGGGNLVEDQVGNLFLVGRYRNFGDSRTGLGVGERGLELAIFQSSDRGKSFKKVLSFQKSDLNVGEREALSIEGAALHFTTDGVELFVSTEKANLSYPTGLESYQKPGTGVWTIERLQSKTIAGLADAPIKTILECRDPQWLHVKDPFICEQANGDLLLGFTTHPFNWASSNSAYVLRAQGQEEFSAPVYDYFPRGYTWDVAISRATAWLHVPQIGVFANQPLLTLLFYDGGESMRDLDEHKQAISRPRGYSCEEIGGLAVACGNETESIERLSANLPLFISPVGKGTSRYVDVLETDQGYYVTWEQSQDNLSQPLVMNYLSKEEAESILSTTNG